MGTITFVITPSPKSMHEAIAHGADPTEAAAVARSSFGAVRNEASLLSGKEIKDRIDWANRSLVDFDLMVHAAKINSDRFTIMDLADAAGNAYGCLKGVQLSLERYVRGEALHQHPQRR